MDQRGIRSHALKICKIFTGTHKPAQEFIFTFPYSASKKEILKNLNQYIEFL